MTSPAYIKIDRKPYLVKGSRLTQVNPPFEQDHPSYHLIDFELSVARGAQQWRVFNSCVRLAGLGLGLATGYVFWTTLLTPLLAKI